MLTTTSGIHGSQLHSPEAGMYLTDFCAQGYAVDSRTYYILSFSFWRGEADKQAKSPRSQSFSHEREVRC